MDAIARSTIHQSLATASSHVAMSRCKSSTLNDPKQALDLIRSLIQSELNEKVHIIMQEYVDAVFQPAMQNIRRNLGEESVSALLLEEVCCNALDHAKEMFKAPRSIAVTSSNNSNAPMITASVATRLAVKRKLTQSMMANSAKRRPLVSLGIGPKSDLPLVTPEGKPVRREGPKWDAKRIDQDTQFILGAKACRLLGYKGGSRLYFTHPSLFKYSLDQEDKERLAEENVIPANCEGKVNILVADDVLELADNMEVSVRSDEIRHHSFKCPPFMIDKMKIYMDLIRTDPTETDEMLLRKVVPVSTTDSMTTNDADPTVHDILNEMKSENVGVSEEDLGFLQNMNLSSLVREFEMEASGQGSQHLGILSLADDVSDGPFSELDDEHHQHVDNVHQQSTSSMADSLNHIEFD